MSQNLWGRPAKGSRVKSAFTLIELLIVVAIIAILAAIALPNFLEAQTRSKISRVKADLRTCRTAIEAYAVDYNHYPRSSWGCLPYYDQLFGEPVWGTLTKAITTPLTYITSIPFDPFAPQERHVTDRLYGYDSVDSLTNMVNNGKSWPNCPVPDLPGFIYVYGTQKTIRGYRAYFGAFYLWSLGPKGIQLLTTGTVDNYFLQYDPTNGTISDGRIFVTQKFTDPRYVPPNQFF